MLPTIPAAASASFGPLILEAPFDLDNMPQGRIPDRPPRGTMIGRIPAVISNPAWAAVVENRGLNQYWTCGRAPRSLKISTLAMATSAEVGREPVRPPRYELELQVLRSPLQTTEHMQLEKRAGTSSLLSVSKSDEFDSGKENAPAAVSCRQISRAMRNRHLKDGLGEGHVPLPNSSVQHKNCDSACKNGLHADDERITSPPGQMILRPARWERLYDGSRDKLRLDRLIGGYAPSDRDNEIDSELDNGYDADDERDDLFCNSKVKASKFNPVDARKVVV
jgi:hypothetical protein